MDDQSKSSTGFAKPSAIDRAFNRAFGLLVKLGIGLKHNYLLEVKGRKSGRAFSTPINALDLDGKRYLVAPRGYTQWVKNVLASKEAFLARGGAREHVSLQIVADELKPEILKAYLDRFKLSVQRFFPVPAGSPVEAFAPLAPNYPVFEIIADR
jgi:deazaflavin-dependent oxidoreductase (nitroreductase family)